MYNTANAKEGTDGQTWRRFKRIAIAIFENVFASFQSTFLLFETIEWYIIYNALDERFVLYVTVILFARKFLAKVKFLSEKGRIIGNVNRINLTAVTLPLYSIIWNSFSSLETFCFKWNVLEMSLWEPMTAVGGWSVYSCDCLSRLKKNYFPNLQPRCRNPAIELN